MSKSKNRIHGKIEENIVRRKFFSSSGFRAIVTDPRYSKSCCSYRDKNGNSLLHIASLRGELEAVESLVEAGMDVDITNNTNTTPLHFAVAPTSGKTKNKVTKGHLAVARFLIEEGADKTIENDYEVTAIGAARYFAKSTSAPGKVKEAIKILGGREEKRLKDNKGGVKKKVSTPSWFEDDFDGGKSKKTGSLPKPRKLKRKKKPVVIDSGSESDEMSSDSDEIFESKKGKKKTKRERKETKKKSKNPNIIKLAGLHEDPRGYDYIHVDENNQVHLLMPAVSHVGNIGRDNTCQTLTAIVKFFGSSGVADRDKSNAGNSLRRMQKDFNAAIIFLRNNYINNPKASAAQKKHARSLVGIKIEQLKQIENHINTFEFVKRDNTHVNNIPVSGLSQYPQAFKNVIAGSNSYFSMVLGIPPSVGEDSALRSINTVFRAGRIIKSDHSMNFNHSNELVCTLCDDLDNNGIPSVPDIKGAKDFMLEFANTISNEDIDKDNPNKALQEVVTILLNKAKELYPDAKNYPDFASYFVNAFSVKCKNGKIVGLKDAFENVAIIDNKKELAQSLVNSVDPLGWQDLAEINIFKQDKTIQGWSNKIQFLMAQANIYCYHKGISHYNFGEYYDANPQKVIAAMRGSIHRSVEDRIINMINQDRVALGMSRALTEGDIKIIKKRFNDQAKLIAKSDHFDEFHVLVPGIKNADFIGHKGRISCDFGRYVLARNALPGMKRASDNSHTPGIKRVYHNITQFYQSQVNVDLASETLEDGRLPERGSVSKVDLELNFEDLVVLINRDFSQGVAVLLMQSDDENMVFQNFTDEQVKSLNKIIIKCGGTKALLDEVARQATDKDVLTKMQKKLSPGKPPVGYIHITPEMEGALYSQIAFTRFDVLLTPKALAALKKARKAGRKPDQDAYIQVANEDGNPKKIRKTLLELLGKGGDLKSGDNNLNIQPSQHGGFMVALDKGQIGVIEGIVANNKNKFHLTREMAVSMYQEAYYRQVLSRKMSENDYTDIMTLGNNGTPPLKMQRILQLLDINIGELVASQDQLRHANNNGYIITMQENSETADRIADIHRRSLEREKVVDYITTIEKEFVKRFCDADSKTRRDIISGVKPNDRHLTIVDPSNIQNYYVIGLDRRGQFFASYFYKNSRGKNVEKKLIITKDNQGRIYLPLKIEGVGAKLAIQEDNIDFYHQFLLDIVDSQALDKMLFPEKFKEEKKKGKKADNKLPPLKLRKKKAQKRVEKKSEWLDLDSDSSEVKIEKPKKAKKKKKIRKLQRKPLDSSKFPTLFDSDFNSDDEKHQEAASLFDLGPRPKKKVKPKKKSFDLGAFPGFLDEDFNSSPKLSGLDEDFFSESKKSNDLGGIGSDEESESEFEKKEAKKKVVLKKKVPKKKSAAKPVEFLWSDIDNTSNEESDEISSDDVFERKEGNKKKAGNSSGSSPLTSTSLSNFNKSDNDRNGHNIDARHTIINRVPDTLKAAEYKIKDNKTVFKYKSSRSGGYKKRKAFVRLLRENLVDGNGEAIDGISVEYSANTVMYRTRGHIKIKVNQGENHDELLQILANAIDKTTSQIEASPSSSPKNKKGKKKGKGSGKVLPEASLDHQR